MLVQDMINRMNQGTPMPVIAEELGVSKDTVRRRLEELGYKHNNRSKLYEYFKGDEPPLHIDFAEYLKSRKGRNNTSTNKSDSKSINNITYASAIASNGASISKIEKENDVIGFLLNEVKTSKERKYKGFYFDSDILEVIEKVSSGNRSNLINEILRKEFKERGLLEG